MDETTQKIVKYIQESENARIKLTRIHSLPIESIDIQRALVDVLNLESELYLIDEDLTSDGMVELGDVRILV